MIVEDADLSWFGLVHEIAPDMLTVAEEGAVVRGASQMLTSYGANAATVRNAATSHVKTFCHRACGRSSSACNMTRKAS